MGSIDKAAGATGQRDASRIRQDDNEHFNVQVLPSGRMRMGDPTAERRLATGNGVLFDMTLQRRSTFSDAVSAIVAGV